MRGVCEAQGCAHASECRCAPVLPAVPAALCVRSLHVPSGEESGGGCRSHVAIRSAVRPLVDRVPTFCQRRGPRLPRRSLPPVTDIVMSKPWWLSKTIWANVISAAVAVLGALAGHEWIATHPEWVAGLVLASSVLNVVLRFLTTEPVK